MALAPETVPIAPARSIVAVVTADRLAGRKRFGAAVFKRKHTVRSGSGKPGPAIVRPMATLAGLRTTVVHDPRMLIHPTLSDGMHGTTTVRSIVALIATNRLTRPK